MQSSDALEDDLDVLAALDETNEHLLQLQDRVEALEEELEGVRAYAGRLETRMTWMEDGVAEAVKVLGQSCPTMK